MRGGGLEGVMTQRENTRREKKEHKKKNANTQKANVTMNEKERDGGRS